MKDSGHITAIEGHVSAIEGHASAIEGHASAIEQNPNTSQLSLTQLRAFNQGPADLFKQDSESSEQTIRQPLGTRGTATGKEQQQQDQIRIFMKKGDQLNEMSYRRLHKDRSLISEHKNLALYRSGKDILGGRQEFPEKGKKIKEIYLGETMRKNVIKKSIPHRSPKPLYRNRPRNSIEVQTESMEFAAPLRKKPQEKSINAEDQEEEERVPKKSIKRRVFSTATTIDQPGYSLSKTSSYLKKVIRLQEPLPSSTRYEKAHQMRQKVEEMRFKTIFYRRQQDEEASAATMVMRKQQYENLWSSGHSIAEKKENPRAFPAQQRTISREHQHARVQGAVQKQTGASHPKISDEDKQVLMKNGQKEQKEGQSYVHDKDSRRTQPEKQSEDSLAVEQSLSGSKNSLNGNKEGLSQQNASLIIESERKGFWKPNEENQPQNGSKRPKAAKVSNSSQIPEVHSVCIGTETTNFRMPLKRPIHPININFSDKDASWIATQFRPKSEFIASISTEAFRIKKYRNGVYFGELSVDGLKQGKGVVFYFNGRAYEGDFKNDLKNGKGLELLPDGSKFQGDFRNGVKEGKGTFQWANGEVYDGQWVQGKKSGSGMWKSPNGDSYIGEWKNGKIEGFGVLALKSGNRYEGEFKNSLRNGLGTQRYENGDTYVGQFCKDRPNGMGQYYFAGGDYYKGEFSNGLKHGNGFFQGCRGQTFTGEFRNDKRCGYGKLISSVDQQYHGNFENDLKHGYGKLLVKGQILKEGFWVNGQQVQQEMGVIPEDQLDRQESLPGEKKGQVRKHNVYEAAEKRKHGKTLARVRVVDREGSLSPENPNVKRSCGCKRKH